MANRFKGSHDSIRIVIKRDMWLAKELAAATKRFEQLGLTDDEAAFYDALATKESAVQAMDDDKLKVIAAKLITQVRKNAIIDGIVRESAHARIKLLVKSILNKHVHPPDLLEQAELLCAEWQQ